MIEVTIAASLATAILMLLHLVFTSAFKALSWGSSEGQAQSEFLILREYFSSDAQHASGLIEEVRLDGTVYRTESGPTAQSLVFRLPAVDAMGNTLSGIFDLAVYTLEDTPSLGTVVRRQLFTTRAASGNPVIGVLPSARDPDDRVLVRHSIHPDPNDKPMISPIFSFDPPYVQVAREVTLSVALQRSGSAGHMDAVPLVYTATFRLRNG